ncbi:MAG: hypothetical protein U0175_11730 [Caldilineaceae bacterium]
MAPAKKEAVDKLTAHGFPRRSGLSQLQIKVQQETKKPWAEKLPTAWS